MDDVSGANDKLTHLLREMIARSGFTHRDLGARLGLSTATLSLIAQGRRYPARDTIIAMGCECGCERRELDNMLRIAGYPVLMGDGPASLAVVDARTNN